MDAINVRVPDDLMKKVDLEVGKLQKRTAVAKVTKSDVVRYILELYFGSGKKDYCTQNDGDCSTCSLVNYGRDCQNNPLAMPGREKEV